MKILVTGAAGMLGSAIVPALRAAGHTVFPTDIDLRYGDVAYLDVREQKAIGASVDRIAPECVVHLAAETDVDKCELQPAHAFETNAEGTRNIAEICRQRDMLMVHVSTAGVFDGCKREPYGESDIPNPINVYGESKFAAEQIVEQLLTKYFIVRAGWMMGGGLRDKKFVHRILQQIQSGAKQLRVVTDTIGAPTYTVDFARCLILLLETRQYGLYHMACKGSCTRYEVAEKILEYLGRKDISLIPITSDQFPLPARRATSEVMYNLKLDNAGLNHMRDWKVCLREYLHRELAFASLQSPIE